MADSSLPVDLHRAAITVSDSASDLSAAAGNLLRAWAAARWSGRGADAARGRLSDVTSATDAAVGQLHDVAALARRIADGVPPGPLSVFGG